MKTARTAQSGRTERSEPARLPVRPPASFPAITLWLLAAALAFPAVAFAQDPLRGRAFEFGPVVGAGIFQGKTNLDDCLWLGAKFGHRFDPLAGVESVEFGFRAGWEGCFTEHSEVGRVDVIHLSLGWLTGFRTSRNLMLYWETGLGELIGDSSPGPDDDVDPRFSIHFGPGLKWAPGNNTLVDLSVKGIVWEGFDIGTSPDRGGTVGVVPALTVSIQI